MCADFSDDISTGHHRSTFENLSNPFLLQESWLFLADLFLVCLQYLLYQYILSNLVGYKKTGISVIQLRTHIIISNIIVERYIKQGCRLAY